MNTIITTQIDYTRGNIIDNLPAFCAEVIEFDDSNILGTKLTEEMSDITNSTGLTSIQAKHLVLSMVRDEAMRFVIEDSEPISNS